MTFPLENMLAAIIILVLIGILAFTVYKKIANKKMLERAERVDKLLSTQSQETLWKTLNAQIVKLYEIKHFADGAKVAKEALDLAKQIYGPDHTQVAISINNLAAMYKAQGKFNDAEPLYRDAMAIWEKVFGKESFEVGSSLNNLGDLYLSLGKYDDAETMFKNSLETLEKKMGKDHVSVANVLENMAELYKKTGNKDKATILEERAKGIRKKPG